MANPRYQTPSSYIGKPAAVYGKPAGRVNRSAAVPTRSAPPRAPLAPPRPPAMTAQAWADEQAQRLVDEQLKAIRDQQAAYNETLLQQAQMQAQQAQRFAQAVQGLGIPQQISDIYNQSGRDIAGMAQGFAGDIRDTAAADAARQTRMVSGTGQEGAVRNEG